MATLIQRKKGQWSLQFRIRPNSDKQTIGLGTMTEPNARVVKERVEALVQAIRDNSPPDRSTVAWVGKLEDDLYAKLARARLVVSRTDAQEGTQVPVLSKFIDDYISSEPT